MIFTYYDVIIMKTLNRDLTENRDRTQEHEGAEGHYKRARNPTYHIRKSVGMCNLFN